jgi:hypothetical protein
MNSKHTLGAGLGLLFITLSANAGSVPLDVTSYNFQLAGGGGGSAATLNGVPVEIYCDDFDNDIYVPSDNWATVTTLGTGANLSQTRFGNVPTSGWTQFTTLGTTDDNFFNNQAGSSALARYAMVAYLVSLYNPAPANLTNNNEIQDAIWSIMDPSAEGPVNDPGVNGTTFVENAATWYMGMSGNQTAFNFFLSHFQVVSPTNMTYVNGLGEGGFQEQIVMTTPEPRGGVLLLIGLLTIGAFLAGRARTGSRVHATN